LSASIAPAVGNAHKLAAAAFRLFEHFRHHWECAFGSGADHELPALPRNLAP